jgi:hypothetical protein
MSSSLSTLNSRNNLNLSVGQKMGQAVGEALPAVLYTLLDTAKFMWVTLVLTVMLGAPEVGGIMSLLQGLTFVPFVAAIYSLSNIQSEQFGRGEARLDLAATRFAADKLSIGLGVVSSVALISAAFIPQKLTEAQHSLLKEFLWTYAPGTIPSLWVIVRQENLISAGQAWSLVGLNLLSLILMGAISYGLTSALGGWGLGLGFTIPAFASLCLFEAFLHFNSRHENGFFKFNWRDFKNNQKVSLALSELKTKGAHSALTFTMSYIGICSTLWVQRYKNPDPANIANGAANQLFFLIVIAGAQIAQSLCSIFIGNVKGALIDEKSKVLGNFSFVRAKTLLSHNLAIICMASLTWPLGLAVFLPLYKEPALHFLAGGSSVDLYPQVLDSFDSALPYLLVSASLDTLRTMLFAAKRTMMREEELSMFDSIFQGAMGLLTFGIVSAIVLKTDPDDLGDIWMPMFLTNYLIPFLVAGYTTIKHFLALTEETFNPKPGENFELVEFSGELLDSRNRVEVDLRALGVGAHAPARLTLTIQTGGDDSEEKRTEVGPRPSPDLILFGAPAVSGQREGQGLTNDS